MPIKANIRVYGNIQGVGYRVLVKNIARILNVKGLVRNLEDGSVEIFAEAEEDTLNKFLKLINVKGKPEDVLSLNVDKIDVVREGEHGYRGPWKKYNQFEIDYGEEILRPIERETVESLEWAKLYFTKLISEFKDYRSEFRDYREEFEDYRNEFRDYRKEFKDYRNEFEDYRKEFRDYRKEFEDFRNEFRDYRNEFREHRNEFKDYRNEFEGFRNEFKDYRNEFKNYTKEFENFRGEFRNFRDEFRDFRVESLKVSGEILNELRSFRDESLKMNEQILGEVRELRKDLKTILDERIAKIERDIAEIKARLGLL